MTIRSVLELSTVALIFIAILHEDAIIEWEDDIIEKFKKSFLDKQKIRKWGDNQRKYILHAKRQ